MVPMIVDLIYSNALACISCNIIYTEYRSWSSVQELIEIIFHQLFLWIRASGFTSKLMTTSSSSSITMPSSQNNSTFVISNITNLVSVKLDHENYLLWRHQFSALLRDHDLYGFVDGTHPCPEKHLTDSTRVVSTKINPEYVNWHRQDHSLIC